MIGIISTPEKQPKIKVDQKIAVSKPEASPEIGVSFTAARPPERPPDESSIGDLNESEDENQAPPTSINSAMPPPTD